MPELNRLYNLDCMEGMRAFPDGFFDLAIVDPPYGVGSVTYMPRSRKKAFGGFLDEYSVTVAILDMNQRGKVKVSVVHSGNSKTESRNFGDDNTSPPPEYFEQLFRVSKHQIIWGGNYFLLPPSRGFVVWRKPDISENFSMAMCEYAWTSINRNARFVEMSSKGTKDDPRLHPTQKPVALYAWLLKHYAKPGDKILDTHAGSASSLIACRNAGLDFAGFEIDADYHRLATERMERHAAQGELFGRAEIQKGLFCGTVKEGCNGQDV